MKRKLQSMMLAVVIGAPSFVAGMEVPPLECLVEPNELVQYSSQVPGILEKVLVERGETVRRGQTLARLKAGLQEAAVELAQARVDFGRRKLERNEQLIKKQLISAHDRDEIETEVRFAELELAEAREHLHLRTIKSTVDGVVVQRLGSAGEYVGEDPFLVIASIDPLSVEVIVPSEYYGSISQGDKVAIQLAGPAEGEYSAKVTIVDPVIDAASSTFGVRLELPNPDKGLPAGVKCTAIF